MPTAPRPADLDCFVGRAGELEALIRCLRKSRVVSLVGPAGVGKTRLALELVARTPEISTVVVELATITRDDVVAEAVAMALDVVPSPTRPLLEELTSLLATRRLRLLLDNCEHVLDGCGRLLADLLPHCPDVQVLTTSRETLLVPGELVFQIEGLGPDAVLLFAARARTAVADFRLTKENRDQVAAVCDRLDGLPLAIELAARLVRPLPLAEIRRRVDDDPLSLLVRGWRTADSRHRDLRTAIGWSHHLLSDQEKALFRRLSVLPGGFGVDGATAVFSDAGTCGPNVVELLMSLEAKSLITPALATADSARFRMLDSIRHYARERLSEHDEVTSTYDRLVAWLTGMAAEGTNVFRVVWRRHFVEHDNFVHAIDHLDGSGDVERSLPLVGALAAMRWDYGYIHDSWRLLNHTLGRASPEWPHYDLVLRQAAKFTSLRGDHEEAVRMLQPSVERLRRPGLEHSLCDLLGVLSYFAGMRGDAAGLIEVERERVEISQQLGDALHTARALNNLAWAHLTAGDLTRATELIDKAMDIDFTDEKFAAVLLHTAGTIALERGDARTARGLFTRAIACSGGSTAVTERYAIEAMAVIALRLGEPERALQLLSIVHSTGRSMTIPTDPWWQQRVRAARSAAVAAVPADRIEAVIESGEDLKFSEIIEYTPTDPDTAHHETLDPSEIDVLRLVAQGLTNRQIATRLGLAVRTIESRISTIRKKLGIRTRLQLVAWAAASNVT